MRQIARAMECAQARALATQRLIRGEDEKACQQLSAGVFAEAIPKTAVVSMLVDQVVGEMWH